MSHHPVAIDTFRAEHLTDALGIGTARPRLSWTVATQTPAWEQIAFELEAVDDDGNDRGATSRVASGESVLVAWPFASLTSGERIHLRVRVWGADEQPSAWSDLLPVEAGLLQADDWAARFITPDWDEDTSTAQPCPLLRREFDVRAGLTRARLYATALGVYEAELNGRVVGDHVLPPGWTVYGQRLRYQTFDVTDLLQTGPNALGATLGDGWFRGRLGFEGGQRNIYGDRLGFLAHLTLLYDDGTTDLVVTDEHWQAAPGPTLASDLYDGETYDARRERPGWSTAGYDDGDWTGVRLVERELATLVAPTGPPVRRTEELAPTAVTTSPRGRTIVDFGQNLVGRVRLTVQGEAGTTVTLRHAEVLQDGELCTRPLRTAKQTDQYTLRGDGVETWEPRFTFHGFRFVDVEGWPGELQPGDLVAVVCHSDLERAGWFESSDPLLNQLHANIVWSLRGNFLDIPTDCPQRDERLGWTGDIQVFAPTATFLYDVAGFLQSWLQDLAAEQTEDGIVPVVVPNIIIAKWPPAPAAAWGDAATIVPWTLYQRYGDAQILADQFDSMRRWVDCLAAAAGEDRLWDEGFQFGDWLDPSAPPDQPAAARTNPGLLATAYFARSAELVGQAAAVLGRAEEERAYGALAAEVRTAFQGAYLRPDGQLLDDAPTSYALAIRFGLLPDGSARRAAGARLAALTEADDFRIGTGFVGTPLVCDALCDTGQEETAFRLLLQRACPSWLFPVTTGATTIWERWDSLLPDGTVNTGQMTSFNHYALGAVADWLHRRVAGLAPAAPGYRRIELRPLIGGGLTHARARHRTPYGTAECGWRLDEEQVEVTALVPPGTTAEVRLPLSDEAPFEVASGRHHWAYAAAG